MPPSLVDDSGTQKMIIKQNLQFNSRQKIRSNINAIQMPDKIQSNMNVIFTCILSRIPHSTLVKIPVVFFWGFCLLIPQLVMSLKLFYIALYEAALYEASIYRSFIQSNTLFIYRANSYMCHFIMIATTNFNVSIFVSFVHVLRIFVGILQVQYR